jgi:chorismate mutase / prephenate dehydratase
MNENLIEIRNQIDTLDKTIIETIQERAKLAMKIGEIKKSKGEPIYRPDREKEVYEKIVNLSTGPLPDIALKSIYKEIMSASIQIEKGLQVAYLGPEGSFSHQAVRARFGSLVDSIQFNSIPEVFKAVETDRVDYGLVPIENSSEGLVISTLDMFLLSDLKIYSEIYIKISLCLLGAESEIDLNSVKNLYGIKIGNSQCKNWIANNLPNCEIIETSSTARAAMLVAEKKEGVAIASKIAAEHYGLQILRENIEDLPNNSTRFLIIGKSQCNPTGKDKTSIVFTVSDEPGSLFTAIKPFYEKKINLTKIESRPTRRNPWEYNFFIDFNGHEKDPEIIEILENLKKSSIFLRVLGSYPASDPIQTL